MRTEEQVYDMILNLAKADERIRMVTLEGSRTNINILPDDFQDYDITFFVTDMQSFVADDEWLDVFGERLIMQKPEDMELFPAVEPGFSYLMLFSDDVKIDLTLLPLDLASEYFKWDKLVKLLLDKDNRIAQPPIPTDIDYHIQRPKGRAFDDCCNEFWNTTPYVVKGLCRKEILFAIDHLNNIVRMELLRMVSWWVGTERGYHFSLGKNYKFLDRYIPSSLWERLMATYRMDSYAHMWESLEQCMELFREVSAEVAQRLGYPYPDYDEKVTGYVVRQKEKYIKKGVAMENTLEWIKSRRSTRKFKDQDVPEDKLDQVIEAGRFAPSGGNCQSTHFIVVKNREVLTELSDLARQEFAKMEVTPGLYKSIVNSINASQKGNYVFHYNAPVLIITANQKDYGNNIADCACALENMMLMANALDLGSCWINQLKWLNENPVILEYMKKLGMDESERVYGALAVGYADTADGLPEREPLKRSGNKITNVI